MAIKQGGFFDILRFWDSEHPFILVYCNGGHTFCSVVVITSIELTLFKHTNIISLSMECKIIFSYRAYMYLQWLLCEINGIMKDSIEDH